MITRALLLTTLVLATSVWVGGYVAIVVVARTAATTLAPEARVMFFRSLGRRFLWLGGPALLIAMISGAILLRHHAWDVLLLVTIGAALALLGLLGVAIVQARRMTRFRRKALADPGNTHLRDQVTRGAHSAAALRAGLGLLTLSLVVLGAFLAVH